METVDGKHPGGRRGRVAASGLTILLLAASFAPARAGAQPPAGTVETAEGEVLVERAGASVPATVGGAVEAGQRVRTGPSGTVRVRIANGPVVTLEPETEVVLEDHDGSAETPPRLRVLQGGLSGAAGGPGAEPTELWVVSPTANVRATTGEFELEYDRSAEVTLVRGISGSVKVHSLLDPDSGTVLISARHVTSVRREGPPERPYQSDRALLEKANTQVSPLGDAWMQSFVVNNTVLGGQAPVDPADTAATLAPEPRGVRPGAPGNSVSRGNDVGALVGQPLDGRGSVHLGVDF